MHVHVKIPRYKLPKFLTKRWFICLLAGFVFCCGAGSVLFLYEYGRYQEIINTRMNGPIFANTASIYAAPQVVGVGEQIGPKEIIAALRRAGYVEAGAAVHSKIGSYRLQGNSLIVMPGPESFYSAEFMARLPASPAWMPKRRTRPLKVMLWSRSW